MNVSAAALLRSFFRIAERWSLSEAEQRILLGDPSDTVWEAWRRLGGVLTPRAFQRIGYVVGIHGNLRILLANPAFSDGWLRRPNQNPLYRGRTPLELLLTGSLQQMDAVWRHLNAEVLSEEDGSSAHDPL